MLRFVLRRLFALLVTAWIVVTASSLKETVLATATGLSLTGLTVRLTVAIEVAPDGSRTI